MSPRPPLDHDSDAALPAAPLLASALLFTAGDADFMGASETEALRAFHLRIAWSGFLASVMTVVIGCAVYLLQ